MKLDLLNVVTKEIKADLDTDEISSGLYYYYEESWFEMSTSNQVDHKTSVILGKAKEEDIAYHAPTNKQSWFYFDDLSIVVRADFSVSPRLETRKQYRIRISNSVRNASNAYKVSHNQLTGLLAKDAFKFEVEQEILVASQYGKTSVSEGQQQKIIAVLALDIDKFKQVNDTYGHLYGDQVLKAFAFRLEKVKLEVEKLNGESIRVDVGHPSGEEFLALVVGTLSTDEIRDIAEIFREKIAGNPLPNDEEWKLLSNQPGLNNVEPPALHERRITTSVGIAAYAGISSPSNFSAQSDTLILLDKADTALYRSKSGGRNRITHFDEILQNCGRVLEFDIDTGVAAIDIGSKVGVAIGQEFRVFSPIFSGQTPFTFDDGRSKRTLGTYPRVEICRLIVFNTQSEMSFGEIVQKESPGGVLKNIPPGAILEAVPLGNISHLIERPGTLKSSILGLGSINVPSGIELQETINKLIEDKKHIFASVFRFQNEQAYVKKYGTASLNRALAKLYSGAVSIFPATVTIGLIDRTSVCVVGIDSEFKVKEKEKEIALMFSDRFPANSELRPICGYYHPSGNFPENSGIEFARYAASGNIEFQLDQIRAFSLKVAEGILAQHRLSRTYKAGIADYLRLKEIGVLSADIENYAGLCYSDLKESVLALECYRRATEADPKNITYFGNFGMVSLRIGEIDEGLRALSVIKGEELTKLEETHPNGYIAYAILLAKGKTQNLTSFDANVFNIVGTKAITLKEAEEWQNEELELIKSTLQ